MTSNILPAQLVLSAVECSSNTSSSSSADPNLMPFSIDYTGPANIDGYMVVHGDSSSTLQYSHFRGRRMYNTPLTLPENWQGNVYSIRRNQQLAESGSATALQSKSDTAERAQLLREKKRRRLDVKKSVPKKAAMNSFSMDDEDDEDEDLGAVDGQDDDGDDGDDDNDDGSVADSYYNEDDDERESQPISPPPPPGTSSTQNPHHATTTLTATRTPFTSLNVWNPDGPLDMGDEELVKVLGEWNQIRALLHAR